MKNFFKKIGEGVKAVANKAAALFAVAALSIVGFSAGAADLVTEDSSSGAVTINADAIVDPVRTAMTSAITSCVTIFVIVLVVGFVFWLIKRCTKG